jgi:hypothetical protein
MVGKRFVVNFMYNFPFSYSLTFPNISWIHDFIILFHNIAFGVLLPHFEDMLVLYEYPHVLKYIYSYISQKISNKLKNLNHQVPQGIFHFGGLEMDTLFNVYHILFCYIWSKGREAEREGTLTNYPNQTLNTCIVIILN